VLSGPAGASPPIEQKYTAIWQNHTANSNVQKIPLFFRYSRDCIHSLPYKTNPQMCYNFNCLHFFKRKFRYFSATFVNSIAVPLSKRRRFQHLFSARFGQNRGVHRYLASGNKAKRRFKKRLL
jgi:hypothetical protein